MKNKVFVVPMGIARGIYLINITCKLAFELHSGIETLSAFRLAPDIAFISLAESLNMRGHWKSAATQIGILISLTVFTLMNIAEVNVYLAPQGSTAGLIFIFAPIWQALSMPFGFGLGWIITRIAPEKK